MTKASDNVFPRLLISEGGSTSTPAAGNVTVYAKANGLLYSKDDAGAETALGGGGGGLTLLEQYTASSSATLDFTSFISSTYDDYLFEVVNLVPATNGATVHLQIGTGAGPTYDTASNYYNGSSNGTALGLSGTVSNAAGYGQASISFRLTSPQSTAQMKQMFGLGTYHDGTFVTTFTLNGLWANAGTAATAVRIMFSSGNIASGTVRVYGLAK